MKNIWKIFYADWKRLSSNVVAVVIIMGLCIIPSLYAWFNIFSNWNPYGPESTSNLKIAVYSEDEGTTLEGISLNVGDNVIDGLKSNTTIGWVFTDTQEEAIEGVYNGDYYAAMVIPQDFTKNMVSFLDGQLDHPQIDYYENEKKNAIAPKITSKAKTAVQEQVNATFVSTLAESVMKASNSLVSSEGNGGMILNTLTNKLNDLDTSMESYINILNSFISVIDSASSLIETTQLMVPDLNNIVSTGQNTLNTMQGTVISGTGSADTVTDMVTYSFSIVSDSLENVSAIVEGDLHDVGGLDGASDASVNKLQGMMPYIKKLFASATDSFGTTEDTSAQITQIEAQMDQIQADLDQVAASTQDGKESVDALKKQIVSEITDCRNQIRSLQDTFTYSVKPQLNSTMNEMQASLNAVQSILYGVNGDFSDVSKVLDEYLDTVDSGSASLSESRDMAVEMKQGLDKLIVDLGTLSTDQQYQEFVSMLQTNPEMLGQFISSPIALDKQQVYPIETYGSAMAPFYTILALWVGALILVAIIHVKVHQEPEIQNVKSYEQFFGRYLTFFAIGQVQTLITVLGDLFYIDIQCHNPFLFWFAAAVSSLVFTLFIYALTVAFGNVGEAIAIVVMVIQVAGAGGTFPIEVLPKVYQAIYKYLPFPYGMDAMRETIGGLYKMQYWKCIGALLLYVGLSLLIGLVVAVPFRKLNKVIEESKENTDLMI